MRKRLEKISDQTKAWVWYVVISPILFVLSTIGLYGVAHTSIPLTLFGSWVLLIASLLLWWGWIIKVISEMIHMFDTVFEILTEIKDEVEDVREEIKEKYL